MTDILVVIVGAIIVYSQCYWSIKVLKVLSQRDSKTVYETKPLVTYTNPDLINPNAAGQEDSVIVEPKSPQLVQWEEEEQVRKLNLKPTK